MARGYVKEIRSQKCGPGVFTIVVENLRGGAEHPASVPCDIKVYPGDRVEIVPDTPHVETRNVRQKFGTRMWRVKKVLNEY